MLPEFELCCSEFERYGFTLSHEQYIMFDDYAAFLVDYNKKINLTAITSPRDILLKHFLDSIMILRFVDMPVGASIIDVGTGAGFPSVPLKIMRNDLNITLLDSLAKRIVFLQELCNRLGLEANYVHGRAEDIAKNPIYREKFDYSCARAVANLSVLSEYCIPFLKIHGEFISMKGPNENIRDSENAIIVLGGRIESEFEYDLEEKGRKIIIVKKISQTSPKYPRNSSQIKKKSL